MEHAKSSFHRIMGIILALGLLMSLMAFPTAADDSIRYTDLSGVSWSYNEGQLQAIQDANQTIENSSALLISDSVQGEAVTAVSSNGFDNVVVGHKNNQYILIPEGITAISAKSFYDFNYVKAVSILASVTELDFNAFDVLGREINNATVIYGSSGSAAERWAEDNSTASYHFETVESSNFSATAGDGGVVYPSGSYYIPDSMRREAVQYTFSIQADDGWGVDILTVDGIEISEASGYSSYPLNYTFCDNSKEISATFSYVGQKAGVEEEPGQQDSIRLAPITVPEGSTVPLDLELSLPDDRVPSNAVAEGMDISDIYDDAPADTSGYNISMGISTGDYYAANGTLYEMVFGTNGTGEIGDLGIVFYNKAQVINYLYDTYGWVYGQDYDLIRMFHYDASVTGGNRKGIYDFHCAFAYQSLDKSDSYAKLYGEESFYGDSNNMEGITNYSTLLVQDQPENAATYVIEKLKVFVSNWYQDKTQVPGKNGGNIALISTTSPSGITVDATKLTNNAYNQFKDDGVPNWLVAAAGGTSTINFKNQNSKTKWDLTGADDSTTELYGNLYCAAASGDGMWTTAAGSMVVNLENSEWTGSIENRGTRVTLNLDKSSIWTVTGTCTVSRLTLEEGASLQAPQGCTLHINGMNQLSPGTYENVNIQILKDGQKIYDGLYTEDQYAPSENTEDAASEQPGMGGDPGGGMSGGPGDPGNSADSSNCSHIQEPAVISLDWSAANSAVAALDLSDRVPAICGLSAGETVLELTAICSDGSQQLSPWR